MVHRIRILAVQNLREKFLYETKQIHRNVLDSPEHQLHHVGKIVPCFYSLKGNRIRYNLLLSSEVLFFQRLSCNICQTLLNNCEESFLSSNSTRTITTTKKSCKTKPKTKTASPVVKPLPAEVYLQDFITKQCWPIYNCRFFRNKYKIGFTS